MKKKIVSFVALLLALTLSACGGSPFAKAPEESSSTAPSGAGSGVDFGAGSGVESAPAAAQERADAGTSGEDYLVIDENMETSTEQESMLTFSLKVDTAAYSNVQRYLESGNLPPHDAVRTEELINYFDYDAALKFGDQPFALYTELAPSPFAPGKQMAFIRVRTPDIDKEQLPSSNLTFLIDTSGSMDSFDKLPLLKEAFILLTETLDEDDRVSIVTYAGSSAVVLDSAPGSDKERILSAINSLEASGSTAGADGIVTAYKLAEKNFKKDGNNRVILATDGDFNVGYSSNEELSRVVKKKKDKGVYLSILGFGTGNIRDDLMETLSKDGNGNYAYINSTQTAKKVLVEELASNLFTVADDVKAQIEFNPATVESFRLIGYENRALNNEDFENDAKDAGEIGVGTDVVVLVELQLLGEGGTAAPGMKYQPAADPKPNADGPYANELFEVRIRYKDPGEATSQLVTHPVNRDQLQKTPSSDFQFACAVAQFGQMLRESEYAGTASVRDVLELAEENLGKDKEGYRHEFLKLLKLYQNLLD